jgi:hypothetical protein
MSHGFGFGSLLVKRPAHFVIKSNQRDAVQEVTEPKTSRPVGSSLRMYSVCPYRPVKDFSCSSSNYRPCLLCLKNTVPSCLSTNNSFRSTTTWGLNSSNHMKTGRTQDIYRIYFSPFDRTRTPQNPKQRKKGPTARNIPIVVCHHQLKATDRTIQATQKNGTAKECDGGWQEAEGQK